MVYVPDSRMLIFYRYLTKKLLKQLNKKNQGIAGKDVEHKAKLLNLKEISKIYSIPLSTLRRWASERKFPLYKISNRILVSIEEFEEWLLKFRVGIHKH